MKEVCSPASLEYGLDESQLREYIAQLEATLRDLDDAQRELRPTVVVHGSGLPYEDYGYKSDMYDAILRSRVATLVELSKAQRALEAYVGRDAESA